MTLLLSNSSFLSLEELYNAIEKQTSQKEEAEFLLFLRGWYLSIVNFDAKTGESLVNDLESFLLKVIGMNAKKDYISRIINHSEDALKHIIQNPREKILREHAIIPIYSARELDSTSVQWLSRQSGRNLREKLAEKPYIKAVQRRFSHDTTENKLFKAFIRNLERYLFEKEDAKLLDKENEELLQLMERWLHNDMTKEIGSWSNFPPNNTLLQDKYYRKIWDSWLLVQELDELVEEDSQNAKENFLTLLLWTLISELNKYQEIRLIQQPIYFDYDKFKIESAHKIQGIFYSKDMEEKLLCELKNHKMKMTLGSKILFMCEVKENNQLKVILNNKIEEYDYSKNTMNKIKKEFSSSIFIKYKLTKQKRLKDEVISSANVILDLSLVYPRYITDGGEEKSSSSRFITQYWKNKEDELVSVDCSNAKAILLNPNILTVSMKNIFLLKDMDNQIQISSILNNFTKKIASEIDTKKLTYLVSDRVDEFSSEKLRKSLNYSFSDTTPLPRSIASAFHLQHYKGFSKFRFNQDDLFIVIEASATHISATKLVANVNQELKNILPQTEGITWERHPSIDIDGVIPKKTLEKSLSKSIFIKDIVNIWGKDGLEKESSQLSWTSNNEEWFSNDRKNIFDIIDIDWKLVKSGLEINDKIKFKIILIGEYANQVRILGQQFINLESNLLAGANFLAQWQKKVNKIALWRDHLPQLSFNIPQDGVYRDFFLVKDTTIIPMKGKVTTIKIDKPLTLPKNKEFYEFPLTLGSGNQELEFMASLRSSILPLSRDIVCDLKMTYTYGADDPYELYFVPKNEKDKELFKSIKVEWKELSKREKVDAPIPDFPKRYSWKDFERFPNKNNDGFKNLLEWIESEIKKIIELNNFMLKENKYEIGNRISIEITDIDWKQAGNGDYFCRLLLFDNKEVFIHQDKYEKFNINYQRISFDLKDNRGGLIAINITKGKSISKSFEFVNKLRKSIRFPLITIWNQGHSLSEIDVPENFRKLMQNGIESAVSLLENREVDFKIKEELRYLLSILHKDTPNEISSYLLSKSNLDNIKQNDNSKMIAYAIGDGTLDWQKELLTNVIKSPQRIMVLSIALWRSKSLIYTLSKEQIDMLIDDILKSKFDINQKNIYKSTEKLEMLLALLRTRGSEDINIKSIFEVDSLINKELIKIIDKLTKNISEENITINTRITFNLNKPQALNKTHDLLYSLRLYLTGDDGANSIEVTEIESE